MKAASLSGVSSVRHLRGWALGLMLLGITIASGPSAAHLDPPSDPPLLTEVDLATLTFLTDWDDGTDGTAELVLVYTVNWGGDHGATVYMWAKDHNFDTIAPPYTAVPPRLVMGTHTECSPAAAPTVTVKAYESDSELDAFASILASAGGGAVGGVLGTFLGPGYGTAAGAAAGGAVAGGLLGVVGNFFNSDDNLTIGVDFTTTFGSSTINLPNGPCSGTAVGFEETTQEMYCSAAEESTDAYAALRYTELATYGVDPDFPFGRNSTYSSSRYTHLKNGLTAADAMTLEYGGTSDVSAKQGYIREAAEEIGRAVAAATIAKATSMGVSAALVTQAEGALASGDTAVSYGDYVAGVAYYDDVGQILLSEMFPEFVNPTNPCSMAAVPAGSFVSRFILILALMLIGGPLWIILQARRRSR